MLGLAFWIISIAVVAWSIFRFGVWSCKLSPFWKVIIRDFGNRFLFMLVIPLFLFLPFIMRFLRKLVAYSDTIEDLRVWLIVPNVKWGLGTLFLFGFFLLFYKVVPTVKVKLKGALPGAAFPALVWQLLLYRLAIMSESRLYGYTVDYWYHSSRTVVLFYSGYYFICGLINC